MPGYNAVSHSPPPTPPVTHARTRAAAGFGNVDVGNGVMPSQSGAPRSLPPGEGMAGFPLRSSPSVDSLISYEFGQMPGPSGFGLGDAGGGEGVQRADYPRQVDRSHPLDPSRQSATYQGQHGQDLAHELSALLRQWDQQGAAIGGLGTPKGETPPDALFSREQTEASINSREHCARTVLAGLGVEQAVVETMLRRHARSEGVTAILDACRLLSMPELVADPKAHAKLEKQLKCYVRAARGDYSGVYRAYGRDSHKEIKKLKDGIETTVHALGYSVIKDRLLADLAPALVNTLARKNPGMSSETLRNQLPNLINTQAFSALRQRMNNTTASGLLQDAPLLPQFVESAEEAKPPPAPKAADPVNDFVKHLVSVLGAIKLPDIRIENNARQIVNQDGWNFQGSKDPRPAPPVEAMPLPINGLPELDDTEVQALDDGFDMTDMHSESGEIQSAKVDVEVQADEVEAQHEEPPHTASIGRFGVPVHPLHGLLMGGLRQNPRFQHAANGGVHPLPDHLVSPRADGVDEEEDEAAAMSARIGGAAKSDRTSPFQRLATPLPMGVHAFELPGRTRA